MKNQEQLKDLFAYLDAADNDDLPDGAWWATLEEAVEYFNKGNGTTFNPNDTVHLYNAGGGK